jgi:hypothetical protein
MQAWRRNVFQNFGKKEHREITISHEEARKHKKQGDKAAAEIYGCA